MWNGEQKTIEVWDEGTDARSNPNEVWAKVPWGKNRYMVSNKGRIVSCAAIEGEWRLLKTIPSASGYVSVGLYPEKGGDCRSSLVHRLVVEAFDGPPPDEEHQDVRHWKKRDKTCNELWNLKWGTRSENMLDVIRHRQEIMGPTPAQQEGPTWYIGYTLDEYLIEQGLRFLTERKLNIEDLTKFWRCSREVATNIVNGETRKEMERPDNMPEKQNRRTTQELDSIKELVGQGLNAQQISETLGQVVTPAEVYYFRSQQGIKLPPGRPRGESHGSTDLTDKKVREVMEQIVAGQFSSTREVSKALGLTKGPTHAMLNGDKWEHIIRPDGFDEAVLKIKRKVPLKDSTVQEIIKKYKTGETREMLMAEFNLSYDQWYRCLNVGGLSPGKGSKK